MIECNSANLFDLPDAAFDSERADILAHGKNVRVERIISRGQTSGWYDQSEAEFVALLEGEAEIEFENGKRVYLRKGGTLLLRPHEKHRVAFTSAEPPCIWLCVFFNADDI
ncbi:MAG: cupin domain-containing protein [Defluviitaleaceae bacterium]|nr:cupin domain-containing protein [Defluviitaleaceae bacterium]